MIDQLFVTPNPKHPLFFLAFRAFFLFGAGFSALAMTIWVLTLNGLLDMSLYGGALFWHIHEMIFGFAVAIVVGFLLTAVQNWTGVRSVNGKALIFLFGLWLVARLAFIFGDLLPPLWLACLDVLFLLVAAFFLSIPLVKVKQTRNLFFVPVLMLLAFCNGLMHFGLIEDDPALVMHGSRSALMLISVLIVVIGGRVIPMFTANGTKTQRVLNLPWLDKSALAVVWCLMLLFLTGLNAILPDTVMAIVFVVAGVLHGIRGLRWRFLITLRVPLLWTLHVAYGFVALGFIVLGLNLLQSGTLPSTAWHVLTVGGLGMIIISMISRVSLGHTGRALKAPSWMQPAFLLILVSALIRTLFPVLFTEHMLLGLSLSGIAWAMAYLIFVLGYFPILSKPRVDQKIG